jgi:hypothetical protein
MLATTVHPLQLLVEALPETTHDFRLDLIVAGEEVITCRRTRRPPRILGALRRCQDRRHPRPGTAARKDQAVTRRSAIVKLARVREDGGGSASMVTASLLRRLG